jgi:hypothetical protein
MRAWQQTWIFWAVGALILTTTPSFAVQSNGGPGGHGGVVGGAQSPGLGSPSPVMGTPEVVFYGGSSPGSCDAYDLPDMAARAWRDINGTVTLAVSWATSRFSTGPSLGSVKHSCDVVFNSTMSGDNSLYADHEWMCSAYMCDDNVTVMHYRTVLYNKLDARESESRWARPGDGRAVLYRPLLLLPDARPQCHGADGQSSGSVRLSMQASMVIWCGVTGSVGVGLLTTSTTRKVEYAEKRYLQGWAQRAKRPKLQGQTD